MFQTDRSANAIARGKKRRLIIRGVCIAGMFALACGTGSVRAAGVLNVGLVPAEDPRLVVSDNQELLDHLHNALQLEIKPFVATDYNGVIEALRAKKLDIALLGPFSYVLAVSVADVEAFAVPETQKQGATYRAVIIARKDRNIASLKDLEGKTFAYVDPSSTSGHLFPKAGLIKAGYDPDRLFSRVIFSGGHDASVLAVQNGKVDAAAIADVLVEMAFKKGMLKPEDVGIIWTSDPIPGAPFVYRRDLPEDIKAKVRNALSEIHDMPWGQHSVIKRWLPTNDAAYDVVRETAKVLNLDLKKMK